MLRSYHILNLRDSLPMIGNHSYRRAPAPSSMSAAPSRVTHPSGSRTPTETASPPTFFTESVMGVPRSTKSAGPMTVRSPLWGTTAIWTIHLCHICRESFYTHSRIEIQESFDKMSQASPWSNGAMCPSGSERRKRFLWDSFGFKISSSSSSHCISAVRSVWNFVAKRFVSS